MSTQPGATMSTLRVFGLDGCVKRYIHLTLNLLMEQKHSDSGPVCTGILPGMQGSSLQPETEKKVYDSAAEVSPLTQRDCPAENKAHDVE